MIPRRSMLRSLAAGSLLLPGLLSQLLAEDDPPRGYVRLVRSLLAGTREEGRVRAMRVKSVFTRPMESAVLSGRRFLIRGVTPERTVEAHGVNLYRWTIPEKEQKK